MQTIVNTKFLILVLLVLTYNTRITFAMGDNCNNPYIVTVDTVMNPNDYMVSNADSSVWFKFVATHTAIYFDNLLPDTLHTKIKQIGIFAGTCSNSTLIFSHNYTANTDSGAFGVISNLIVDSTYYIKIVAHTAATNLSMVFVNNIAIGNNTILYPCTTNVCSNNFIENGDFEQSPILGNCDYRTLTPNISTGLTHLCFIPNAQPMQYGVFNSLQGIGPDHSGSGMYLHCDPISPPEIPNGYNTVIGLVFRQSNINIIAGQTYVFSLWSRSADDFPTLPFNSSKVIVRLVDVNNTVLVSSGFFTANTINWTETKFCYLATTSASIKIEIFAESYSRPLNSGISIRQCDFDLDDIVFGTAQLQAPLVSFSSQACINQPITATISNPVPGAVYSWNYQVNLPGNTIGIPLAGTCNNPPSCTSFTFIPASSINYFVHCAAGACGNFNTSFSAPNFFATACCMNPVQTISNSGNITSITAPSGSDILVQQGVMLTVSTAVNLSNYHIYFEQGASINILFGGSLTLSNTHLQGCAQMWDGIAIQAGGLLLTNLNTLIEDALTAVAPVNGSTYNIQSTIFNKNYRAIYVSAASSQNGIINNSIFTCREINHGSTVANLKANNFLASLPLSSISNAPFSFANGISRSGVEIINVFSANPSGQSPNYNISIGEPSQGIANANVFDNLQYGIYTRGSNIQVRNNQFQNIKMGWLNGNFYGMAIYGEASPANGLGVYDIRIGGPYDNEKNTYNNVGYGVYLKNYRSMILQKNQFSASSTAASNASGLVGLYGILLHTNSIAYNKCYINCQYNTISNYNVGIAWNRLSNSRVEADFNWNTINATATNSANQYCNKAIDLKSLISIIDIPNSHISVSRNTISQVRNGILVEGFQNSFYETNFALSNFEIHENIAIGLKYSPISTSIYCGIKLTSCKNINIHDNSDIYSSSYANTNMRGIYLDGSYNCKVTCNTVHHIGRSIAFINDCNMNGGATISSYGGLLNNTMGGTQIGISLETNALIGDQGWSGGASDNKWVGNYGPILSAALNSTNITPTFWVRNSNPLIYSPIQAAFNPSFTAISSSLTCTDNGINEEQLLTAESIDEAKLRSLIDDAKYFPVLDDEAKWINKQNAYELLLKDSLLSNSNDTAIINFRDSIQNENIGTISEIRELLLQNMTAQAEALRMSMTAYNIMESNYNIFFDNYIRFLSDTTIEHDSIKRADMIAALLPVAQQCPNQGGAAVIEARALLGYLGYDVYYFEMDCNVEPGSFRKAFSSKPKDRLINESNNCFLIASPNPTKDWINLNYRINENGNFTMRDVFGNVVLTKALNKNTDFTIIDVSSLSAGCYYYSITSDKIIFSTKKLLIVK